MKNATFRFYYGLVLIIVGIGVFFRIPRVMDQVAEIEFFRHKLFVVQFCFYMLGILLIVSGIIRIRKKPPK